MSHAITLRALAVATLVLCFGLFYLTGLVLQSARNDTQPAPTKSGEMILVLLSVGWLGLVFLLSEELGVTLEAVVPS